MSQKDLFCPYYGVSDFRNDCWNKLKLLTRRRERRERRGRPTADQKRDIRATLETLAQVEAYFAFPGVQAVRQLSSLHKRDLYTAQARQTERIVRMLVGDLYRGREVSEIFNEELELTEANVAETAERISSNTPPPYFEVMVVDDVSIAHGTRDVRKRMLGMRRDQDEYIYDVVVVRNFQDAVIAALTNFNIQSVVVRYNFPLESPSTLPILRGYLKPLPPGTDKTPAWSLGRMLREIRPELDLFLVTDDPVRNIAGHTGGSFRRVFYDHEDYLELHLSILRGIHERYETPFFNALREYSHRPTGVFHAMPISRGKSIMKSHWIRDMGEFYGDNLFLAETSATTGGLDSLLQPHGPIKQAQEQAARAFGAQRSYFVTNGTSTANKIVVQALLEPGDIALVSRDCHKSHHYAVVLSGAMPVYMDPYPLQRYSIYGAVTIKQIKRHLLELRAEGKLERVAMLLLTNCTFDGIVYHPERVMMEILAIKPDMVFVWDEAWFAFARFSPLYRQRTAMASAHAMRATLESLEYRQRYNRWKADFDSRDTDNDEVWIDTQLLPDPDKARIRLYATQSTHKTLTSLRQGSMIHVYDQDFGRLVHEPFEDAYMTHTSTSPNYQILASLDLGRRQVELEGCEMVGNSVELAMTLRERVAEDEVLSQYFQVLTPNDLIPAEHRQSGLREFYNPETGYARFDDAFAEDEFVVDPTRVTVHVGNTGMDGDTLRTHLMDKYDIQINKTSRNTVLFMLNIGTTRGAIAYLLEVLTQIARDLDERSESDSALSVKLSEARVKSLTQDLPPLPNFSRFHESFRFGGTPEGDLRAAYFSGRNDESCVFLRLDGSVQTALESSNEVVSAGFVTPYPPGFPVLVPGQVISQEILDYLKALDVKEIHGYNPEFGLRVFKGDVLAASKRKPRLHAVAAVGEQT